MTTVSVKSCVTRPPENLVARATYDTARCLGSATRTARDGFGGVGKLILGGPGALIRYSRAIGQRIRGGGNRPVEEGPLVTREGIRAIIIEERARWQAATGGTNLGDLEKRLRRMAETIEALFVGIDLGTSRASVSASNGVREVVPTYVGYSMPS